MNACNFATELECFNAGVMAGLCYKQKCVTLSEFADSTAPIIAFIVTEHTYKCTFKYTYIVQKNRKIIQINYSLLSLYIHCTYRQCNSINARITL